MTGRAAGFCAGFNAPGFANPGGGRGFGGGWGRGGGGRGWRNRFYATGLTGWQRAAAGGPVPPAPASDADELDALKAQAQHVTDALEGIRKRIDELEAGDRES